MPKNNITKYVSDWLKRADEDSKVAEILLKENGLPNSVCFHCQQAAEKYLKGFLAFKEKHVRKIHDVEMLLELCGEIDASFGDLRSEAEYLSKFYIETRYPADIPEFSSQEAKEAYEMAKEVKDFVLSKIQS